MLNTQTAFMTKKLFFAVHYMIHSCNIVHAWRTLPNDCFKVSKDLQTLSAGAIEMLVSDAVVNG